MRVVLLGLVGCVVGAGSWAGHPSARAEDGVVIQSLRIEGTIPKADDPIFKIGNPYAKDWIPDNYFNGQFVGGELTIVVMKGKLRTVVSADFGGDKKLKAQAEKLAGQRVVVECKGEYQIYLGKIDYQERQGWSKRDATLARIVLTVVKIELAK